MEDNLEPHWKKISYISKLGGLQVGAVGLASQAVYEHGKAQTQLSFSTFFKQEYEWISTTKGNILIDGQTCLDNEKDQTHFAYRKGDLRPEINVKLFLGLRKLACHIFHNV